MVNIMFNFHMDRPGSRTISTQVLGTLLLFSCCLDMMFLSFCPFCTVSSSFFIFLPLSSSLIHPRTHRINCYLYSQKNPSIRALNNRRNMSKQKVLALQSDDIVSHFSIDSWQGSTEQQVVLAVKIDLYWE